ncbi:hypothetical protein P691DRAFT_131248 [Macrolepiota fuliginosa MF-IS2]|uniref:Transmembrane protein n=1 Tax=Macrolepiota fuliginosa MF-IS2 TaxID=1400762 RepID=A0A9P6C391_9AGAR|nr:hypothetical protein P691DRAFT_131248 [Macrolepiota fuliginosa MF-IS2]
MERLGRGDDFLGCTNVRWCVLCSCFFVPGLGIVCMYVGGHAYEILRRWIGVCISEKVGCGKCSPWCLGGYLAPWPWFVGVGGGVVSLHWGRVWTWLTVTSQVLESPLVLLWGIYSGQS